MAGLVALVVFTLVLVTVTLVVVRARAREAAAKTRPPGEVEQYRRLPLVPEGGLVCCDTQASSTKSCSCYSRSGASHCHYIACLSSIRLVNIFTVQVPGTSDEHLREELRQG